MRSYHHGPLLHATQDGLVACLMSDVDDMRKDLKERIGSQTPSVGCYSTERTVYKKGRAACTPSNPDEAWRIEAPPN